MKKYRVLFMVAAILFVACGEKKPIDEPEPEHELTPEEYYGFDTFSGDSEKYAEGKYASYVRTRKSYEGGECTVLEDHASYKYDEEGRLLRLEFSTGEQPDRREIDTYEYADRHKKESVYFESDGSTQLRRETEYDYLDEGLTMCFHSLETSAVVDESRRTEQEWENGRMIRQRVYWTPRGGTERITAMTTYSYSDTDYATVTNIHSESYRASGTVSSASDQKITVTYKDKEKKYPLREEDIREYGHYRREYAYNEDHLLVSVIRYLDDVPFHTIRYSYSGDTKTEYSVTKSLLDNTITQEVTQVFKYRAPAIEYEYISDF
jgi:hypothetical protein